MSDRELQSAKITLTLDDAQLRESLRRIKDEAREGTQKSSERTTGTTIDPSMLSPSQRDLVANNNLILSDSTYLRKAKKGERRVLSDDPEKRWPTDDQPEKDTGEERRKKNKLAMSRLVKGTRLAVLAKTLDHVTSVAIAADDGVSRDVSRVIQGAVNYGQLVTTGIGAANEAASQVSALGGAISFASDRQMGAVDDMQAMDMFEKRKEDNKLQARLGLFMNKVEGLEISRAKLEMVSEAGSFSAIGEYLGDKYQSGIEHGLKGAQKALGWFAETTGMTTPAGTSWR